MTTAQTVLQARDDLDSPRGWRVVAGTHAVVAVTFGSAYAFSALFPALAAEFDASRGEVSLIFSLAAFLYYSLGAVAGVSADKWPTRRMVMLGLVALIVGYGLASRATSFAGLTVSYALAVGLGIGFSYVPSVGAVQSWFVRRRAQASGAATAGLGVGTLVMPYAAGYLVTEAGWRWCFVAMAVVVAVIGLPGAWAIERRPSREAEPAAGLGAALRDSRFRLFYAVLLLSSFAIFIPYVHIVPAAQDAGLSLDTGALLIGVIGVGNVIGRFVLAGYGDSLGAARLLAWLTFLLAAAFVLWAVADGVLMFAAFAALFGLSYGGSVGLYPTVAADLFGVRAIGALLGALYTAVGIAALLGPPLAGAAFDLTGSYLGPIVASGALSTVAGVLTLRLARAPRHHP